MVLASQPAYAGLKAHYRFDGGLKDATGQHHGRPRDAKVTPIFGKGVSGDGLLIETAEAGIEITGPEVIDKAARSEVTSSSASAAPLRVRDLLIVTGRR